jgi:hypothetical protein
MTRETFAVVESLKNAEKKGYPKAYLARLLPSYGGAVSREFAPKLKEINKNNHRAFRMQAREGDVFEARRWKWDAKRKEYFGGTCWFGCGAHGKLFPMTREEAHMSVFAPRIEAAEHDVAALAKILAERVAPQGVFITTIDLNPALKLGEEAYYNA